MELYHDKSFHISVSQADLCSIVKLPELIGMFSQAADEQLTILYRDLPHLDSPDESFILLRYRIDLASPIAAGDTITVRTYQSRYLKRMSVRDFFAYREGQEIASASTQWVYIEKATQKLINVPAEYKDIEYAGHTAPEAGKISEPALYEREEDLPLTFLDYDENRHVNHISYFRFLYTDSELDYSAYRLKSALINYRRGMPYGEAFQIASSLDESGEAATLKQKIYNEAGLAALIESEWVKL